MNTLANQQYRQARLSRDARFDGVFFVGVLSTGIYCRPICPAVAPQEQNVRYFDSASAAAAAGLRPCLRCRPESAPGSNPWLGTDTTMQRALCLIEQAALDSQQPLNIDAISARLGISSRWLRRLFASKMGTTPIAYVNYCRVMFAKQLLHQTQLPITEVAFAAGFQSVRRFNEVFQAQLQLSPSSLRRRAGEAYSGTLQLTQSYRPPYDWAAMLAFYRLRAVAGMEWFEQDGQTGYGRTLSLTTPQGQMHAAIFAVDEPEQHQLRITIQLATGADMRLLPQLVKLLRRMFDLDADPYRISAALCHVPELANIAEHYIGTRITGVASSFEAGIRAVLGQQVSVTQAIKLLNQLVQQHGTWQELAGQQRLFFPTAAQLARQPCQLAMPKARQQTIDNLARFCAAQPQSQAEEWLPLKGIGPWTVAYAQLRGEGWPDVLLASDLVIKKQLVACGLDDSKAIAALAAQVAPWGSYLTFILWRAASSAVEPVANTSTDESTHES
ncbi:helix-turn-helix domain-containing protein [Shewanella sp. C32]|uniref:DNA-3-methyladenine glycosylase II n=1 Tax=Shewanella electrica TaxID=515560 RepID=A0ABT2FKN8_9GAMM|nr:AlkA N-terminal domain-containing protein [Shewanella electrica]MCH1924664.1 helix-turn-helix domain-containing protein [Shewanella electrica]MCS4556888.1 helix-turn-helix domain-containing protein [Shewanella electrica]